jgi:hypothetical protein
VKAGFAERDITPVPGTILSGFGYGGRPSDTIRDRLSAKALVFTEANGDSLALVSTDLLLMSAGQIDEIERQLGEERCVVLVNHSHTHSGPALAELGIEPLPDFVYVDELISGIVDAVREARASAVPAQLMIGRAESRAGVNRRPGLVPNPNGPYDPSVSVLRVVQDDGEPIACWFSFAAHPTILEGPEISADWPGAASQAISKVLGVPALFAQGCAGDVMPLERNVEVTAQSVAQAAGQAWSVAEQVPAKAWVCVTARVTLPTSRPVEPGENDPELRVSAARLGELTVIGLNCEPFVRIGEMVDRLSSTEHTVVLGYTNGCFGYLPDAAAFTDHIGSRDYALDDAPGLFRTPPLAQGASDVAEAAVIEVLSRLK